MKEELLHFIWKYRLFRARQLFTVEGEEIRITNTGTHNFNSGPDFSDARIEIGDTLWVGNVEIHLKTSDWYAHKHNTDPAYKNVILHVVFQHDMKEHDTNIPVLELADFVDIKIIDQYALLLRSRHWIPCENMVRDADSFIKIAWLNRLSIERFERKYEGIMEILEENQNDWSQSFYVSLARNFGFHVNSEAFEHLAKITPVKILGKHKDKLFQIEAILFGQAGLLNTTFKDEFPQSLAAEYKFLKHKYDLQPMKASQWKFSRLRPSNFPTIRLSQFAQLIYRSSSLFSHILDTEYSNELKKLFMVEASAYWHNHFVFDKKIERKSRRKMGMQSLESILINTVAPYIFAYGKNKEIETYCDRALVLMESIKAEKNSILSKWETLGFRNASASDSQALLLLKKNYCDKKKCLDCAIGTKILR